MQEFKKIEGRELGRGKGVATLVCRVKESAFGNTWRAEHDVACFEVAGWKPPFYSTGKSVSLTHTECEDACNKLAGRDDVSSDIEFLQKTRADGYMPIRCQAYE